LSPITGQPVNAIFRFVARTYISSQEADKIASLYDQLPDAVFRAAVTLRANAPGHSLSGNILRKFVEADAEVAATVTQIQKILRE
jgi:hypothetical protein